MIDHYTVPAIAIQIHYQFHQSFIVISLLRKLHSTYNTDFGFSDLLCAFNWTRLLCFNLPYAMSYCSPRSFHSSCLINYARTLAELNPVPWEKVSAYIMVLINTHYNYTYQFVGVVYHLTVINRLLLVVKTAWHAI